MTVLNVGHLARFARKHRDAAAPLERWLELVRSAGWASIGDIRKVFPSADGVPVKTARQTVVVATVFNIKGNRYRLITVIKFEGAIVIIREVLTHTEYDKNSWKDRL